jgi:hypothetical protein
MVKIYLEIIYRQLASTYQRVIQIIQLGGDMGVFKTMAAGLAFMAGAHGTASAQTQPMPSFAESVAANRHALAFEDGTLSGPGAELLAREMTSAQFFLIGEQHATATIAEVSTALHRQAAEMGYAYSAVEIGPHSAREVERIVRTGTGRLAATLRGPTLDFSVPFLFWAEEAVLAEQMVSRSPSGSEAIWGLDQEFIGSLRLLMPRLEALARTPAQRRAVADLRARSDAEPMALGRMPADALAPLSAAFGTRGEGASLVADLTLSNRIYGPFTGRGGSGFEANTLRETYMKRNFLTRFAAAEARDGRPPRVFLKFGANHMMRGLSTTNVPALGNFIAEWGLSRGFGTVNVFIDCVGGEQNDPQTGANSPCESRDMLPDDSPLRSQMGPGGVTLFDLRPLRARLARTEVDPLTRRLVLAFDFYLAIRNTRPATPLRRR